MNKTLIVIIIVLVAIIGGYFLFKDSYQAPTPELTVPVSEEKVTASEVQFKQGDLEEIQAKFTGASLADWQDYQKDPFCIDGSVVGQPELGAMGFHATKFGLLDDGVVDPLNPETLLLDEKDNIVGVEYMVKAESQPSLFETPFEATPEKGHPGFGTAHWDLHLWLIDNPAGRFAPFNSALTCPERSLPPAPKETEAPTVKEFTVSGTEYSFNPPSLTVSGGQKVKLTFKNEGSIGHDFVAEGLGMSTQIIDPGQTETVEFLAPVSGTYTFFCSVPGHRSAGMEGDLKVE